MKKTILIGLARLLVGVPILFQQSACAAETKMRAEMMQSLNMTSLKTSYISNAPGVTAEYCDSIASELENGDPILEFLEPIIEDQSYSVKFDRYQRICPELPLNRMFMLLRNVNYEWWKKLPKSESELYVTSWYGNRNAKLFDLSNLVKRDIVAFYAEGYYSDSTAKQIAEAQKRKVDPRDGYANSPGASAQYTVYDLKRCESLGGNAVHESTNQLTGESLPNKSALIKRRDELLFVDLYADNVNRKVIGLQIDRLSSKEGIRIEKVCSLVSR